MENGHLWLYRVDSKCQFSVESLVLLYQATSVGDTTVNVYSAVYTSSGEGDDLSEELKLHSTGVLETVSTETNQECKEYRICQESDTAIKAEGFVWIGFALESEENLDTVNVRSFNDEAMYPVAFCNVEDPAALPENLTLSTNLRIPQNHCGRQPEDMAGHLPLTIDPEPCK